MIVVPTGLHRGPSMEGPLPPRMEEHSPARRYPRDTAMGPWSHRVGEVIPLQWDHDLHALGQAPLHGGTTVPVRWDHGPIAMGPHPPRVGEVIKPHKDHGASPMGPLPLSASPQPQALRSMRSTSNMSQEPKRTRTPEELLDAIEEADAADEAERILALSDEALDQELADAGFDPKAVRRRGEELAKQAMRASDEKAPAGDAAWATVVPLAPPKPIAPRWVMLLAAALATVVVGGGVPLAMGLLKHDDKPVRNDPDASPTPSPKPSPKKFARARSTRVTVSSGRSASID